MARTPKQLDIEYQAALGARIREARLHAKLTQEQLAFAADLSTRHISDIENGLSSPGAARVARLARALRLQPGALMPRIDLDTGRPEVRKNLRRSSG